MIYRYYHLLWASSLALGFVLCKISSFYLWFKSNDSLFLVFIVISFLLLVLIHYISKRNIESCNDSKIFPGTAWLLIPKEVLFFYGMIFILLGLFCSARDTNATENNLLEITGKNITNGSDIGIEARGRISSHINYSKGSCWFYLDAEELSVLDRQSDTMIKVNAHEEFFVIARTALNSALKRDDIVSFKCQLKQGSQGNYLLTYGHSLEKMDRHPPGTWHYALRSRIYNCIKNIFYNSFDYRQAGICEAAMLGNTFNIDDGLAKDFRNSGIYHLLAISGLHISFFVLISSSFMGYLLNGIVTSIGKRQLNVKNLSLIIILAILFLYNFIIGENASTLRSTVMAVFVLFSSSWGRAFDRKAVLSFTFIILLIASPGFFKDASFWLSFSSVAAISYLNDFFYALSDFIKEKILIIFRRYSNNAFNTGSSKRNYFESLFITSLSVNIVIFPIIIFVFGQFGLLSIPVNMIAVPVFYALLLMLVIASFCGLLWPPLGILFIKPVAVPMAVLLKMSQAWKISGYSILRINDFKPGYMVLYYAVMALIAVFIARFLYRHKRGVKY